MGNVTFKIIEHLGVLSATSRGWTKELNIVQWNDSEPVYDIRLWDEEHQKMSKGITLNDFEVMKLKELLQQNEK